MEVVFTELYYLGNFRNFCKLFQNHVLIVSPNFGGPSLIHIFDINMYFISQIYGSLEHKQLQGAWKLKNMGLKGQASDVLISATPA